MTETFYDVLGVTEDATTDEIQSAYRERLKEVHPDVSDDDDAGETTQRLVEARDVLVDEDERARYDRVGHENYVAGDSVAASAAESATETDGDTGADTDEAGGGSRESPRDRAQRERRASQRVRQERAREAGSATRETTGERTTGGSRTDSGAEGTADRQGYGANATTADAESTYDVRTNVTTERSFGPILPSGHRLTLLAIFFVLYPLLLFSALLPAFPLFVNLTVGACALILVGYLQSMPRISLLVFGGWSAVGLLLMLSLGVEVVSLLGFAILGGTGLPFAFSLLTAWALRY